MAGAPGAERVCDGWFVERFQAATHPRSSPKAADRLAAAGIATELALPVVPTGWDYRAEPGATDRAFLTRAELSLSFRPGEFPSCRQLRVVLLCLERAPRGVDGFLAHGVELRHTTSALLVVIVGLSGGCRGRPDFRSMQPSAGVLVVSQFTVALAQAGGTQRRVVGQPGQFAKLMGVDPMRKHRMVRQRAQPTPIAPRTALRFDALPQPGLLDQQPPDGNATAARTVQLRPFSHAAPLLECSHSKPVRALHAPTAEPSELS